VSAFALQAYLTSSERQSLRRRRSFARHHARSAGYDPALRICRSQDTNTLPKPSYFSPNSALELAAVEDRHKACGGTGGVRKCTGGLPRGRDSRRGLPIQSKLSDSFEKASRRPPGARPVITTRMMLRVRATERRCSSAQKQQPSTRRHSPMHARSSES
jgi:hypothetical protein